MKFGENLVKTILCCYLDAYLIVMLCYHFHFMYF